MLHISRTQSVAQYRQATPSSICTPIPNEHDDISDQLRPNCTTLRHQLTRAIRLQVARLRCALARYLVWEVNASRDFRYQIRPSDSMPYQPCLMQLAGMLKQAAQDQEATTEERHGLLQAIQTSSASASHQQLAVQVGMQNTHIHWKTLNYFFRKICCASCF